MNTINGIGKKRLEEIAYGPVRQSAEEGTALARFALSVWEDSHQLVEARMWLLRGRSWHTILNDTAAKCGWYITWSSAANTCTLTVPVAVISLAKELVSEIAPTHYRVDVQPEKENRWQDSDQKLK